MKIVHDL